MRFPIMVAPTALQVPVHPDGESGMRRAAVAASNTPIILSGNSSTPIEKFAAAATGPWWQQFYPQEDRDNGRELLDRGPGAGCAALVVTVDQQASYYERTQQTRNLSGGAGGRGGARGAGAGAPATPTGIARYRVGSNRLWYTWSYLDEVKKLLKVPMVIKGIVSAEDAKIAIDHGADAIVVSNHGGRSMDYGPVHARGAAGDRGRRRRPRAGAHRQRLSARRRRAEGARARSERRAARSSRHAGDSARSERPAPSASSRSCSVSSWPPPRRPAGRL